MTGQNLGIAARARVNGVSRQRQWQVEHRAQGLCTDCSRPALTGYVLCPPHLLRHRVRERVRKGSRPWQESPLGGRPPGGVAG
jgi:hypothetical protein